jgi:hypothetical protein
MKAAYKKGGLTALLLLVEYFFDSALIPLPVRVL